MEVLTGTDLGLTDAHNHPGSLLHMHMTAKYSLSGMEFLAVCPADHPFFVIEKGKTNPDLSL